VRENAAGVRDGRFDLIWLPPPSFAGEFSAGYNPKEYFRLDNSYGSLEQQRAMLEELLRQGVEPVADIVVNHRDGLTGWADFKNPAWGPWAICGTDEGFRNPDSKITETPPAERGQCEERPAEYTRHGGTTYQYESFRDIAHTDRRVRQDVVRYVRQLRSVGYRGWRYDMVHGYHAKWIALYNRLTTPTFSVGECDWGAHNEQRGWIWYTATNAAPMGAEHLRTSSSVFDFTTLPALEQIRERRYHALYGFGNGIGMVGDTTDGLSWKNRAVTFVQNHDLGYRTKEEGKPGRAGVRARAHASGRAHGVLEALLRLGDGPAQQDQGARQRAQGRGRARGQRGRPPGQRALERRVRGAGRRPPRREAPLKPALPIPAYVPATQIDASDVPE
jgi:alpha-amylase